MEDTDAEQARAAVRKARKDTEDAEAAAATARARYHQVLADQQRLKILRQSELAELTGYNREHLRRIARAAGVSASRR